MFDAKRFLQDYNLEWSDSGPNTRTGWVQTRCPFCDDRGHHLGFNVIKGYCHCWRCDWKPLTQVISTLLGIDDMADVYNIVEAFGNVVSGRTEKPKPLDAQMLYFHCNRNVIGLGNQARKYLISRRFNPDFIIGEWKVKQTLNVGKDYKYRIMIPIYLDGRLVSFTSRDYTDKQTLRYKSARSNWEIVPHKETLYGIDKAQDRCIVVEGVTDAWRIGPGAVATFGIQWSEQQAYLISQRFKRVAILYDSEVQAQKQAEKLGEYLEGLGVESFILGGLDGDPADMNNDQVEELRKGWL